MDNREITNKTYAEFWKIADMSEEEYNENYIYVPAVVNEVDDRKVGTFKRLIRRGMGKWIN